VRQVLRREFEHDRRLLRRAVGILIRETQGGAAAERPGDGQYHEGADHAAPRQLRDHSFSHRNAPRARPGGASSARHRPAPGAGNCAGRFVDARSMRPLHLPDSKSRLA